MNWTWDEWDTLKSNNGATFDLRPGKTLLARRLQWYENVVRVHTARQGTVLDEAATRDVKHHHSMMVEAHRKTVKNAKSKLLHAVRDSCRSRLVNDAAVRRRDCQGMQAGINRDLLEKTLNELRSEDQPIMRAIHMGALLTADRVFRSSRGPTRARLSPNCPYCNKDCIEDEWHRFWTCEAWDDIRLALLGGARQNLVQQLENTSNCNKCLGIPTNDLPQCIQHSWAAIVLTMVAIQKAIQNLRKQEES